MRNLEWMRWIVPMFLFLGIWGCQNSSPTEKVNPQEQKINAPEAKNSEIKSLDANKDLAKPAPAVQPNASRLETLRNQIKQSPLFEKWHYSFASEQIREIYYAADMLFVETLSKKLYAIHAKNGTLAWLYMLPDPLDFKPEILKDKVYLLGMAKLHILNKNTGSLLLKKELDFVPCSPLCLHDKYIFVGAWDNFLYALEKKIVKVGDKESISVQMDWRYRIDGRVQGQPALMDGVLYFPGTDNRIYAISSESGRSISTWAKTGRYETRGANVGGLAVQATPAALYAPSRDYNLYSLNRGNGDLRWKFESSGEIKHKPFLTTTSLSFVSEMLDRTTMFYNVDFQGELRYKIENGLLLLFIGSKHDFVVKNNKTMVAVPKDRTKEQQTYSVNEFAFFVYNSSQENQGFLASSDGYIFAVEEK